MHATSVSHGHAPEIHWTVVIHCLFHLFTFRLFMYSYGVLDDFTQNNELLDKYIN